MVNNTICPLELTRGLFVLRLGGGNVSAKGEHWVTGTAGMRPCANLRGLAALIRRLFT